MSIRDIITDKLWDKEHDLYLLINPLSTVKRILNQKIYLFQSLHFTSIFELKKNPYAYTYTQHKVEISYFISNSYWNLLKISVLVFTISSMFLVTYNFTISSITVTTPHSQAFNKCFYLSIVLTTIFILITFITVKTFI